jgi:hypothetical protein
MQAALSGKYTDILIGGAVAGGKTFALCALAILLAKIYPHSRWAMVRENRPKLETALIPEFRKLMPDSFCKGGSWDKAFNASKLLLKCANGSEILFWPAVVNRDKDFDRWKGLNVSGFLVDEANEVPYDAYIKAGERAGRWQSTLMPRHPPNLVLMSCNPARNWIKTHFFDRWKTGTLEHYKHYIPAKLTDNPSLEPKTVQKYENMRESNPAWYDRFVNGNWDLHEEIGQLISTKQIEAAFERGASLSGHDVPGEYYLGVDVALQGDDKTVLALRKGDHLVEIRSWEYNEDTSEVAKIVRDMIIKYKISPRHVNIDVVGLGAGVASELKNHYGMSCVPFNSAKSSDYTSDFYEFRNLRAEGWWKLRERFVRGEISFDKSLRGERSMVDEMCAVTYDVTEKVLFMNKKSDIKKTLSRSPDYADAVMYAYAAIKDTTALRKLVTW